MRSAVVSSVEAGAGAEPPAHFSSPTGVITAAVVTPVGELKWAGGAAPAPASTDLTFKIRQALVDVQFGRAEDTFGWMHRLV